MNPALLMSHDIHVFIRETRSSRELWAAYGFQIHKSGRAKAVRRDASAREALRLLREWGIDSAICVHWMPRTGPTLLLSVAEFVVLVQGICRKHGVPV